MCNHIFSMEAFSAIGEYLSPINLVNSESTISCKTIIKQKSILSRYLSRQLVLLNLRLLIVEGRGLGDIRHFKFICKIVARGPPW